MCPTSFLLREVRGVLGKLGVSDGFEIAAASVQFFPHSLDCSELHKQVARCATVSSRAHSMPYGMPLVKGQSVQADPSPSTRPRMKYRELTEHQITQSVIHVVVARVFVRLALLRVALQLKALNGPFAVRRYL